MKLNFTYLLMLALMLPAMSFAQRNCGTMQNLAQEEIEFPGRMQRLQQIDAWTQNRIKKYKNGNEKIDGIITIPVVFHVVWNTSIENLSAAQLQSQLDILNEDFRRLNSDADNTWPQAEDSEIEFCLATVDPQGNPTTGITRTQTSTASFSTNNNVKFNSSGGADAWPSGDYMNFWTCDLNGFLGYAQFPGGSSNTDGVVCDFEYVGNIGTATAPFDLGRTATHEVGHWLNLRHIWGDGGCNVDDFVSDTPTSDAANYNCASTHVSCGSLDMVQNYMDYSDDACMNLFTAGQNTRMRSLFDPGGFRESLLTSNGCGTAQPPTCTDGIQNQGETGVDCGGPCPNTCPPSYCTSNGTDASFEWISNVSFATINNTTGSDAGYGDYTAISTAVIENNTYAINLTPDFATQTYAEYFNVYIDYNRDFDFEDAGELVFQGNGTGTVTGSVTIPTGITPGSSRMRVSMLWNEYPAGPCVEFQYGEVEDYTVILSAGCALSVTAVENAGVTCNGGSNGSATASASNGIEPYSYLWDNGETNAMANSLTGGSHSVTASDALGCTAIASVDISQPTAMTASSVPTNVSCFDGSDGSIDLTVNGGTPPYTYIWSGGGGSNQDPTGLSAGTYTVNIFDDNLCLLNWSEQVGEPTQINLEANITDETFPGSSDGAIDQTVTGGTPGYSYLWSNGTTTEDLTGIGEGLYSVTTTDNNGCEATGSWTVNAGSSPVVSFCLTTLLEGSFDAASTEPSTRLRTSLRNIDLVPLAQPYSTAPWNYAGAEAFGSLAAMPTDVVDWILVTVRDYVVPGTILGQAAGVLHTDGSITDVNGANLSITVGSITNYYIELSHRHHLSILSSTPQFPDINNEICYDFTGSMSMSYRDVGLNDDPVKLLGSAGGSYYGMISGNTQSLDCQVDINDVNFLFLNYNISNHYGSEDVNMDGIVDLNDINIVFNDYSFNCHKPY